MSGLPLEVRDRACLALDEQLPDNTNVVVIFITTAPDQGGVSLAIDMASSTPNEVTEYALRKVLAYHFPDTDA